MESKIYSMNSLRFLPKKQSEIENIKQILRQTKIFLKAKHKTVWLEKINNKDFPWTP